MRNPVRTEAEAFGFLLVVLVLVGAIAVGAALGGGWVALGVLAGIVLGLAAGIYLRGQPPSDEPAVWERDRPPAPPT